MNFLIIIGNVVTTRLGQKMNSKQYKTFLINISSFLIFLLTVTVSIVPGKHGPNTHYMTIRMVPRAFMPAT
jgi:hypothetical protein